MAKRFKFRFETLLKIRRQREDEHKRIVGERLRQIGQVQDQLESLGRQIEQETEAVRASQAGGTIDIRMLVRHRHWLGHLHKSVLEGQARLGYLEAELAQERAALTEAMKQRRILEELKANRLAKHSADRERQEARERDEMATVRFTFNARNEAEALATT
jgi:flagellar FliJ protein